MARKPAADAVPVPADQRLTARVLDADHYVAERVRQRRLSMGLSQKQVADLIAVSTQQVHKYERGLNRISVGQLYGLSVVLEVPVAWFYDGFGSPRTEGETQRHRLSLEMMRNVAAIEDEKELRALNNLACLLIEQAGRNDNRKG